MTEPARVRPATPEDVGDILRLIAELADYEKESAQAVATPADLQSALFPDDGAPTAFAHVAQVQGRVVGMAVWFLSFSTWTGRNGIWLEDLYVEPGHRGAGIGVELLRTLAQVCLERGYPRLEWHCLDWNEPSIEFYRRIGADQLSEWLTYRMGSDAMTTLAESADSTGAPADPAARKES